MMSRSNRGPAARCPLIPDGQITRIFGDHLPYLIAQLLPVADEIAGLRIGERFDALLFEDRDNSARFRLFRPGLDHELGLKNLRHAVELLSHCQADSLSPLHLSRAPGQSTFISQSKPTLPCRRR